MSLWEVCGILPFHKCTYHYLCRDFQTITGVITFTWLFSFLSCCAFACACICSLCLQRMSTKLRASQCLCLSHPPNRALCSHRALQHVEVKMRLISAPQASAKCQNLHWLSVHHRPKGHSCQHWPCLMPIYSRNAEETIFPDDGKLNVALKEWACPLSQHCWQWYW